LFALTAQYHNVLRVLPHQTLIYMALFANQLVLQLIMQTQSHSPAFRALILVLRAQLLATPA
jgi:hypothetical protein